MRDVKIDAVTEVMPLHSGDWGGISTKTGRRRKETPRGKEINKKKAIKENVDKQIEDDREVG